MANKNTALAALDELDKINAGVTYRMEMLAEIRAFVEDGPSIPEGYAWTPGQIRADLEAWIQNNVIACGFVPTVEQRPLLPLAMGHYETVVSVRAARS